MNRIPDGVPRSAWLAAPEAGAGAGWRFAAPRGALAAADPAEVPALLAEVERATARGLWAVGYVTYEAAPGFDAALEVAGPPRPPLAAFALFDAPEAGGPPGPRGAAVVRGVAPAIGAGEHAAAVAAVRAAIARGDTYQVNLTFPLRGRLDGAPESLFAALAPAARAPYAAFLDLGARAILSLSPELFFERTGERLRMRPMKGTRGRGRFAEEDAAMAAQLAAAEKDRAENLMIVDMARNDLGRVARPGSVAVARLFELERYPTVWQMTSSVEAASAAPLPELFAALFPCASVTGAPKAATMRAIATLERRPRGVYCGAIGWAAPGGRARFSVAIRTAEVERATGELAYGVGSGVVWDSEAGEEWRECLAKGAALAPAEPFRLFETMLHHPRRGALRLERHLARLAASAGHFDFAFDAAAARAALAAATRTLPSRSHRLRLELAADGALAVEVAPFARERRAWTLALASEPVDAADTLLFHKSTRRIAYDRALAEARARGADEPLLANGEGELTEGARTNLVVEIGGRRFTPPRESGLLAGVFRAELLARGRVEERVLGRADLARARRIWMVNALRGWIPVGRLLDGGS